MKKSHECTLENGFFRFRSKVSHLIECSKCSVKMREKQEKCKSIVQSISKDCCKDKNGEAIMQKVSSKQDIISCFISYDCFYFYIKDVWNSSRISGLVSLKVLKFSFDLNSPVFVLYVYPLCVIYFSYLYVKIETSYEFTQLQRTLSGRGELYCKV